jgi:RNA polymerase sigma factor (sigma-70 family)
MNTTRSSLISRVRDFGDASSWVEFDRLYRPLLAQYVRRCGVDPVDAEEIAQQCLEVVVHQIPEFQKRKSFRGWLRAIADNKVKRYFRDRRARRCMAPGALADKAVAVDTPEQEWERQWELAHLAYCIENVRGEFAEHTFRAFELYVIYEKPVAEIVRMLGMTANQVYVAKSRVCCSIRERFHELMQALYGGAS